MFTALSAHAHRILTQTYSPFVSLVVIYKDFWEGKQKNGNR